MRLKLQPATIEDAEAVAALRNAVSDDLTFKQGKGGWTQHCTTARVLADLKQATLHVALHRGEVVASLVLGPEKPWAMDLKCFSKARRPLFITSLVVAPELQRQGLGRACLGEAIKLARRAKAGAVFLDTYDHPGGGAGAFFARCGFRECGRATYRSTPLVYYEQLV